jgi:hypothetical protein
LKNYTNFFQILITIKFVLKNSFKFQYTSIFFKIPKNSTNSNFFQKIPKSQQNSQKLPNFKLHPKHLKTPTNFLQTQIPLIFLSKPSQKSLIFRERLHKANHEAFDVELNILSKQAILQAWESRTKEDEAKYSEVIERLRQDLIEEVWSYFSTFYPQFFTGKTSHRAPWNKTENGTSAAQKRGQFEQNWGSFEGASKRLGQKWVGQFVGPDGSERCGKWVFWRGEGSSGDFGVSGFFLGIIWVFVFCAQKMRFLSFKYKKNKFAIFQCKNFTEMQILVQKMQILVQKKYKFNFL